MPIDIESISHIKIGEELYPFDAVTVNGQSIPDESRYMPTVSAEDNGKILMVVNGQWRLFTPSELYNYINGIPCGIDTGESESEEYHDYTNDYLTFEVLTPGTIIWKSNGSGATKTISYSINNGSWTSITSNSSGVSFNVSAGDTVMIKGTNSAYCVGNKNNYSGFVEGTATYNVSGNIMSLIYGDNFVGQTSLSTGLEFTQLFKTAPVVSAGNLILPATTLSNECYRGMFSKCSTLTVAPELPATTLAEYCYWYMFEECAITKAPFLPATTVPAYGYGFMFTGCSNLNEITCLATDISATDCTNGWVTSVASSGTFYKDENMEDWTIGINGIPTNWVTIDYGTPVESESESESETDYINEYLTFDVKSSGNITWTASDSDYTRTISYSKNDGAWTDVTSSTSGETISVTAGDKVRFKGSNSAYGYHVSSTLKNNTFGGTATFDVYGNIMSLVGGDDFVNVAQIEAAAFVYLFKNCIGVLSAANLKLPITTLATYCYQSMFNGCTNLTAAPELPAHTLAGACYNGMFLGCTSLTTAPELFAVTLAQACYYAMFQGCTSLTTAPSSLPATTLVKQCYQSMFQNCTSLTTIPTLSGNVLKESCYQSMFQGCTSLTTIYSTLTVTLLAKNCYNSMFKGCTHITNVPQLNNTLLYEGCYREMFSGCTSLTTAPELPATTLANHCYNSMFLGCTSLTIAPSINSTTLPAFSCSCMFYGCTSLTTAPTLTATTVQTRSCESMFNGCTSLTSVSSLPATTLGEYCYASMFEGCTNLVTVPSTLPATTLVDSCYYQMFKGCTGITTSPTLPATTLVERCYYGMFQGCTSLTSAPELPATTLANYCYIIMFQGCTSLTTAPELPATTLASSCYQGMFNGCTNLNYIKCLATNDNLYAGFASGWVYGVAETGTFVKDASATSWPTGENGIPTGWIVDDEGGESESESESESETPTPIDQRNEYLTFNITSAGNIATSVGNNESYEYQLNDGAWTSVTSTISVSPGDVVKFRGACQKYDHIKFEDSTCAFTLSGNVMSIYSSSTFTINTKLSYASCFSDLFKGCTGLTSVENLVLPATTLSNYCYASMFEGCTSLTTSPVLPAQTLMEGSYGNMFKYCSSLNYIKCLATDISARYCVDSWVNGVAASGTFVKDPSMNDWTINSISGIPVGWTVVDNGDEGESEEPIITVSDPVISYSNNTITISCITDGATIYYKLGENGEYQTYSSPVSLNESTTVYAYASLSGTNSTVVSENCVYVEPYEPGDSDYGDSDSESDVPVDPSHDYSQDYLTFNITTSGNIATTVGSNTSYQYRKNGGEWTSVTSTISVTAGDVVEFKGTLQRYEHIKFESSTCGFTVSGNVMSIYNPTTFTELTTMDYSNCFENLFKGCTGLTSAENLILPATTLTNYCYNSMFEGCTSLTTPPVLPASTLSEGAYGSMFKYCSSLNYIKCLATDISARYCVDSWVQYVAASGTFVKADSMNDWTIDSISGIPVGWTLINASDESGQDEGDSDSESEEPVITVSAPELSYSNNTVTITCDTTGATIYYKLGESGTYQEYTTPVVLSADTTVYAYASLNDVDSEVVSEEFVHDYSLDYLTFDVLTGGNILWKSIGSGQEKTISYSINDGEWTSITATPAGTAIPVSAGDVVRFKGTNSTYAKDKSNYSGFDGGTATYNVEGNMMSLIYGDNFVGNNTLSGTYNFCSIFKQSKAVSAENMILPATTLTTYCYRAMFSLAPNLITPPALPATTLAQGCYWYMFEKCPMSTAPDLLASTLVQECYGNMFTGCSNLNYIKCLATTKSATNCLQNWVKDVAATGTFVKDANTTWSTGVNGIPTGWVVYDGEIVEDPVINFNGENKIEISCETSGTTIYYRLGTSGSYTEYTGLIIITEDVTIYAYAEKDGQQSQTVSQECVYSEHIYKFGDLVFASGPLYYGNDGYEIKDSWNYSSYGTVYGKNVGSTFFNYIEMGDLFKKSGFSSSDGPILNTLDPLDGWRLPTKDEWDYIVGSTRPGSTVNGASGKHYAFINFDHDNNQNTGSISGLLIFPDNETITGATLSYFDSISTNVITLDQFNNYLSQGCVFLHADGIYQTNTGFSLGGLDYWSSSDYSESTVPAYALTKQSEIGTSLYSKEACYLPVYLVKDTTYGEETPFEGATKSLNTWTI